LSVDFFIKPININIMKPIHPHPAHSLTPVTFFSFLPYLTILLTILSFVSCSNQTPLCVSPDGSLKISLIKMNGSDGGYGYQVESGGIVVCPASPLGIKLASPGWDFTGWLKLTGTDTSSFTETYQLTSGKKLRISDAGKEAVCRLKNSRGNEMIVRFRTFNDGVAFRYELQNPAPDSLLSEVSGFSVDPATRTWMMEFRCDYEHYYYLRTLDTLKETAYMLPALFETPAKIWILACEAGVYSQYPAAQISPDKPGTFHFHLPDQKVPGREPRPNTWEEYICKETQRSLFPKN
jgi:hypothetical protein